MPSLTFPYSFSARTLAQSAQVNANFAAVSTLLNSTKLDSSNIQTGGIATANYAAGSINNAALAANAVQTTNILDANVTTVKILDANVTTAKIADAAITQAKLAARATGSTVAAGGVAVSASSGNYSTSSTTPVGVTNLSVTITTTGRPVFIGLQSDGTANPSAIQLFQSSGSGVQGDVYFLRDASTISQTLVANNATGMRIPLSSMFIVDTGAAAGTHTYTVKVDSSGGFGTTFVQYASLVAYEL